MAAFPPELVRCARQGDPEALEELCRGISTSATAVLRRAGATPSELEDVVQDCIVRVLRALKTLKHENRLAALVVLSSRHAWFDHLRRKHKQQELRRVLEQRLARISIRDNSPHKAARLEAALVRAIESMPLRLRKLFFLWKLEGLTTRDIATDLGVCCSTVKNLKLLLLKKLKDWLNDTEE